MTNPSVEIIAAVARDGGIGRGNELVWREREDLQHFKQLTLGAPIVMGRRTWDSIGRPLPGRRSLVVTRNLDWHAAGAERAGSFDDAIALARGADRLFVIGGAQLYALALPRADVVHLTEVDATFAADTWFPSWPRNQFLREAGAAHIAASGETYRFVTYRRMH